MVFLSSIRRLIETTGYSIYKLPRGRKFNGDQAYDQDGLWSVHNHDFLRDPGFIEAYQRGVAAAGDLNWHWRVHVGLWAACAASKLEGDFVECGVNYGFLSSAIMQTLDWDSTGKTFYLLDTFAGIDAQHVSTSELAAGIMAMNEKHLKNGFYVRGIDSVKANFSQWKHHRIIQGSVPETLSQIDSAQLAFLHLDMNCAPPEVAAFEALYDRLVPGAFILLDDYAYRGFAAQKAAMDEAAKAKGLKILSLPTGQGLMIKPPRSA